MSRRYYRKRTPRKPTPPEGRYRIPNKSSRYAYDPYSFSEAEEEQNKRIVAGMFGNEALKRALAKQDPLVLEGLELGAEVTFIEDNCRAKFKAGENPWESSFSLRLYKGAPTLMLAGYPLSYFLPKKNEPAPDYVPTDKTGEGGSRTAPTNPDAPLTSQNCYQDEKPRVESIAVDVELLRLSIARREFSEMRLWSYARAFDKDGSGRVNKAALWEYVRGLGVIGSKRTFDHILRQGSGLYWRLYGDGKSVFVSLTGWVRLAELFTGREWSKQAERVETDQPGAERVYLDLSGDLEAAQARMYAAWMAQRTAKYGFMRISRARLQQLWGRSTRQLIRWEQISGIQPEACYAEQGDIHNPLIPGHAYLCLEEDGKTVFASWRTSNRYKTPTAPQKHPHSGQRRKVRAAVNRRIEASEPVYLNADGRKTGRIHFFDQQRGKRWQFGYKVLRRHLKKHGDASERRHFVQIGKRHGKHIEEMSSGDVFRSRDGRRDYKGEQQPDFQARAALLRSGWNDRNA